MKEEIGTLPCPECRELQPVIDDSVKFYIKCEHCSTFTCYQAKAAKDRVYAKLNLEPPEFSGINPDYEPKKPQEPVPKKSGFFDSYSEWF